jgi:hypothetical protein
LTDHRRTLHSASLATFDHGRRKGALVRSVRNGVPAAVAALFLAVMVALPAGEAWAAGSDPKPIPGGIAPGFHYFVPGPKGVTKDAQGIDTEPSTITDYKGFTALGYINGTATGSDGRTYPMKSDLRAYSGRYVGEDGQVHKRTFVFI